MSESRRMVVVSQQFPPDKGGLASRMRDTTTNLVDEGWDVDVLAPPAAFPHGGFDREWYRQRRTELDGVTVNRLWAWQPVEEDPTTASRLAYYITFALHATLWLLVRARRYDVVFTTTPPISTGLAGFVSRLAGATWVVDVRDLWIDASVSLGFLAEGGAVERASRLFQRTVLRAADGISLSTERLGETLCAEYGSDLAEKAFVVPNGVDISRFGQSVDDDSGSEVASGERPEIVYVGNIGHAQALDVCIEAMARIEEDAVLRLIGGGDALPTLQDLVEREGVADSVEFVDPVPREEIPAILRDADVGIAPIVDDEELAYAMPTKVYEYLGSGLPIVVTGRGELERFVEASGGGRCVDETPEAVAAALDELLADPDLRRQMGRSGFRHVEESYDRGYIASRLDSRLRAMVAPRSSGTDGSEATLDPELTDGD